MRGAIDLWASEKADYLKELNNELKKQHPLAIVVAGKVNRVWYEEACLQHTTF